MLILILLLLGASSALANYPNETVSLLDAGAYTVIVQNDGTGGVDYPIQLGVLAGGHRWQWAAAPIFVPPSSSDTASSCSAPCTVSINRNWGWVYWWKREVDSSGNPIAGKNWSPNSSAYTRSLSGATPCSTTAQGVIPQVKFPVVTTSPMPMPLVIVGQDCYAADYRFPLVSLSGFTLTSLRLAIQGHNLGYNNPQQPDGKLSVSINGGAWLTLTNSTATPIDRLGFYGGIGGFEQNRELSLALPNGTISSGDTSVTMSFRFDGTEGVTSGFRIRYINIIEANKTLNTISISSNVATAAADGTTGYTTGDTVLVQNAPGMYMRFNGLRTITGTPSGTSFTFAPCGTGDAACTSPNILSTDPLAFPPISTDTVSGDPRTAQAVMYSARCLIAKSSFTQTDPSTWTAPVGGDPVAGEVLFKTAALRNPVLPYFNNAITATCSDCHTFSGSDLYRFNYDNASIRERSKFHGLTDVQGDNIAAYIRGLSSTYGAAPAKGRPWNPPMQPGPGMSTATTAEFFAGCGIDCRLMYGYEDAREYLLADPNKLLWNEKFNMADMPIPYTLADISKGWWPTIFPGDFDSNFLTSTPYLNYVDILANMTPSDFTSFQLFNYGQGQTLFNYRDWVDSRPGALYNGANNEGLAGNWYPSMYPLMRQSVSNYSALRIYEVAVDKDTFKFGSDTINALFGTPGLYTFSTGNVLFNKPAHKFTYFGLLNCYVCNESHPNRVTFIYDSHGWYVAEAVKGGGNGWGSPDAPIDGAYLQGYFLTMTTYYGAGYLGTLYTSVVSPQTSSLHPDLFYHNGPGAAGMDFGPIWSKTVNSEQKTVYPLFTAARWTEMQDQLVVMANAMTSSRSTAYWNQIYTNAGCGSGTTIGTARNAWTQEDGGLQVSTMMWLAFDRVWGVNSTNLNTLLTFVKSLDCGATHNYDADYAAGADGTGTTNGAQAVTGDLSAGSVTVTFNTSGGHTGCPGSVAQLQNGNSPYTTFWGGTGHFENLRPTGGTCAATGGAGTLTFTTNFSHTGAWKLSWGCDVGIPPNWQFNGNLSELPWWRCSNMF